MTSGKYIHTKEHNNKVSLALKGKTFSNRKGMLNKHHSKETKEIISNKNKGKHFSINTEFKIGSKVNLGHKHSEETLRKISKSHKGQIAWNKGRTYEELFGIKKAKIRKEEIRKERETRIIPIKDTSIELKIQNFLKQLNISFFTHQYIKEIEHGYQCDILIPSMNLIIECDGDYWHNYPIGTEIDNIRTKELLEKGFKVLRLWEKDIKVMDLNKFREILR